jgi:hypothetical protein
MEATILISLILLIIGITYQIYTNNKYKLDPISIDIEIQRVAKESLDNLIQKDFTYLDFKAEVFDVIISMRLNPDEWSISGCLVKHYKTDIEIWIANDVEHRRFYNESHKDIKFTPLEKIIIDKCCKQLVKWQNEKAREIVDIIDNKFVK